MIKIQILGTGCAKCEDLFENAKLGAKKAGWNLKSRKSPTLTTSCPSA